MKLSKLVRLLLLLSLLLMAWAALASAAPSQAVAPPPHFTPERTLQLIGHEGGAPSAMAVQGQYAYLGLGSQFAVLDLSNPAAPQRVGRELFPAFIIDVEVRDRYAYVATGDGLHVVDVQDPTRPVQAGYMEAKETYDLTLDGDYVYAMHSRDDGVGILLIVDVENPTRPRLIGQHATAPDDSPSTGTLAVAEGYAYVTYPVGFVTSATAPTRGTFNGEVEIVDVRDPAAPAHAGAFRFSERILPNDILVQEDYAYISAYSWEQGRMCLVILNISTQTKPEQSFSNCYGYADDGNGSSSLAILGQHLYLAGPTIRVLDVSNPAAPVPLRLEVNGSITGNVTDLIVTGDSLYTLSGGSQFTIFRKPSPTALDEAGDFKSIAFAKDLAVQGKHLYVADQAGWLSSRRPVSALRILDVANPLTPTLVGSLPDIDASGIAVAGQRAYVVGTWRGASGSAPIGSTSLTIADIEDPTNPVLLGSIAGPTVNQCETSKAVAMAQTYLYMNFRCASSTVKVSNPSKPQVEQSSEGYLTDIVVREPYAYRTGAFSGSNFQVLDVTQPGNPQTIGSVSLSRYPEALAISDTLAYIAPDRGGLTIVDVSDPTNPTEISSLDTLDRYELGTGIAVWGSYAFVSASTRLLVYDVSEPAQPRLIDSSRTQYLAESVAVDDDGTIYLADGAAGVRVFRLTLLYKQYLPLLSHSP